MRDALSGSIRVGLHNETRPERAVRSSACRVSHSLTTLAEEEPIPGTVSLKGATTT